MPTRIAWTDESWNPVTGCTPVSEGCAHCYAKKMSKRFGSDFSKVTLHPDRLDIPLHWRKPRMVFVPSMGDLFHEDVPGEFISDVFAVMAIAHHHTFQVLTKRPKRMRELLALEAFRSAVDKRCRQQGVNELFVERPLPNVWLGVSVENQARADERIPILLDTPAAVRFVSAEPLLGPLNLARWLGEACCRPDTDDDTLHSHDCQSDPSAGLDWVIVGGESGGPEDRRLVERCVCMGEVEGHDGPWQMCGRDSQGKPVFGGWHPKPEALAWVRSLRDQCQAAGVAFFLKQLGPRAGQGTLLDGKKYQERPEVRA